MLLVTCPSVLPEDTVDDEVQGTQDIGTETLATCQGLRTAIARPVWVRVLRHRCLLDFDEPYLSNTEHDTMPSNGTIHACGYCSALSCLSPGAKPNAGAQARLEAEATQERSNCLGCQGCLVYFLVLNLLCLPGRPMLQHGIEHRQQFMHTRGESDFFDFPCSE